METYYDILGISESADLAQIKKAYRKLAMKWHPDRNTKDVGAEEKFKKISRAYETLSDPVKRKDYDYGLNLEKNKSFTGAGFDNSEDVFEHFFRNSGFSSKGFEDFFGFRASVQRYRVDVGFWEAIFGCEKSFFINVEMNGRIVPKKINVILPPVCNEGDVFVVNFDEGSVEIVINILDDEKFKRNHLDLYVEVEIPFTTAILGGEFIFPHWDGDVKVSIPAGIQGGERICLPSRGIKKDIFVGDLYLYCKIAVPKKINDKQRSLLQEFKKLEEDKGFGWVSSLSSLWKKFRH